MYLTRVDGHAGWVNRKALEIAGLTAATPDPPGGKILRDASGAPTGVLIDRAQELVGRQDSAAWRASRFANGSRARRAMRAARHHDGARRRGGRATVLEPIAHSFREHQLPMRIYAMIGGEGELWREYLQRGPEIWRPADRAQHQADGRWRAGLARRRAEAAVLRRSGQLAVC